jgi:hypothetical protein
MNGSTEEGELIREHLAEARYPQKIYLRKFPHEEKF